MAAPLLHQLPRLPRSPGRRAMPLPTLEMFTPHLEVHAMMWQVHAPVRRTPRWLRGWAAHPPFHGPAPSLQVTTQHPLPVAGAKRRLSLGLLRLLLVRDRSEALKGGASAAHALNTSSARQNTADTQGAATHAQAITALAGGRAKMRRAAGAGAPRQSAAGAAEPSRISS